MKFCILRHPRPGNLRQRHGRDNVLNLIPPVTHQTGRGLPRELHQADGESRSTASKARKTSFGTDQERRRQQSGGHPPDGRCRAPGQGSRTGLFSPVSSKVLESRIPAHPAYRGLVSFSTCARVIVYNKTSVKAEQVKQLRRPANPALKGKVCSRSGSHPYNLSPDGLRDRQSGRSQGRSLGQGVVATSPGPPGAGIRTRSRRWPPASARLPFPTPTTSPDCCAQQAGRAEADGEGRRRLAPRAAAVRISTSPARAS